MAAAADQLRVGCLCRLHYRDRMWHTRLVIKKTTAQMMTAVIGEVPTSESVWWVLTPGGDVYPEKIAVTADLDYFVMNGMLVPPRRRGRANFAMADAVHDFPVSMNLALSFVEALEAVHRRDPEASGRVPVPAAPARLTWRVVSSGWPGLNHNFLIFWSPCMRTDTEFAE